MPFQDILTSILTIIGYEDDRKKFVDKFIANCSLLTIADILQTLPQEKRTSLIAQIASTLNIKKSEVRSSLQALAAKSADPKQHDLLQKLFAQYGFQEGLQKRIKKELNEFFKEIVPTLSEEQKEQLQNYLTKLSTTG